jgi:hypothetical protein
MTYHAYDNVVPTTTHASGIPLAYQEATHGPTHDETIKAQQDQDLEAMMDAMNDPDWDHEIDNLL